MYYDTVFAKFIYLPVLKHHNQSFLYGIVNPGVYFDPHSFNHMVLKENTTTALQQTNEKGLKSSTSYLESTNIIPIPQLMTEGEVA